MYIVQPEFSYILLVNTLDVYFYSILDFNATTFTEILRTTLLKIVVVTNAMKKTPKNGRTSLLNWNLWIFSVSKKPEMI